MRKYGLFVIGIIFSFIFIYIYVSTLMFGEVVPLSMPVVSRYDVMSEAEIEAEKETGLDWLWWDEDSYIEYQFSPEKEYLDIQLGGAKSLLTSARVYFGINGVYNEEYETFNLKAMSHNACKITDSLYNCAKIYPVGNVLGEVEDTKTTIFLSIKSLSVTEGKPGQWFFLGTVAGVFLLTAIALYLIIFCRNSFWFAKDFRYKYYLGILICFVSILLLKEIYYPYNGISYFADAGSYFTDGDTFVKDGKFSLHNYLYTDPQKTNIFRGCLLPLFIYIMKQPGVLLDFSTVISYDICASLFFALFFAVGIPKLWEALFKKKVCLAQILLPLLLFIVFLRGLLMYPLSDFYSAIFATWAVLALLRLKQAVSVPKQILWGAFAGATLYLAYNIRSSYMLLVISSILFFCYWERKTIRKLIMHLIIIAGAMLLISIPQMIVNYDNCGIVSPLIQTSAYNEDRGIIVQQLMWGLKYNRFESELVVGNDNMARRYINPMGSILYDEYISNVHSMKDFLLVCLAHPVTVSVIWCFHFLTSLDLRFPDIINGSLASLNGITFFLNCVLWWLCILKIWVEIKKAKQNNTILVIMKKHINVIWITLLILPSLAQIVGAFETRFGVMLYLFSFVGLCYSKFWEPIVCILKDKKIIYLGLFIILVIAFGLVWSMAYANPDVGIAILMD